MRRCRTCDLWFSEDGFEGETCVFCRAMKEAVERVGGEAL